MKHEARVAAPRGQARDVILVEKDAAGIWVVKAGEGPEKRRLSTTARAQEKEDLAGLDVEIDGIQRYRLPKRLVICRREIEIMRACHGRHSGSGVAPLIAGLKVAAASRR